MGRIERDLHEAIEGDVLFDAGSRALYATDSSNYRQIPIGIVRPMHVEDVLAALEVAHAHDAPILGRGAGTSLAGQSCNVAIVLDFSRHMNRVLEIDPEGRFARVEPGVVLDNLRDAAEVEGLTFGPDPATHNRCTLGGMIGNNSCGVHSIMAGKTDANVEELDVVTWAGTRLHIGPTSEDELDAILSAGDRRAEIYSKLVSIRDRFAPQIRERFPKIPRAVSGYGLPFLLPENGFDVAKALVGSESTCVIVLEARLSLVHSPPCRNLVVLGFSDVYAAADRVVEVLSHGPIGLEGFDDRLARDVRLRRIEVETIDLLPDGGGWLLVEFGGETMEQADRKARAMIAAFEEGVGETPSSLFVDDRAIARRVWKIRESALGATAVVPGRGHAWEGWEDAAVPPSKLGGYLRDLRALLDRYGYEGDFYGHFGDGCVHTRNDFDLESTEGIAKFRSYMTDAAHLVSRYGGSFSGEHGDGQSRGELLPIMFGDELIEAFREFKEAWDPNWKMNPGKVVEPYRLDENLRRGERWHTRDPETHFSYPDDDGVFDTAVSRCVGVGLCRRESSGTMCPSWMVTREEKHSTRGRARLLYEMLQGQVFEEGWESEAVRESLDLCLACKGCRSDCPTHVDMATYKAEFFSHYYEKKRRPVAAHAMGQIHAWARMAAIAPRVANFVVSNPLFSRLMKRMAGIARERDIPSFAATTFRKRIRARKRLTTSPDRVILWVDTFNNSFHPEVLEAAVAVLESGGFEVVFPPSNLCCGRPLYDWGFLRKAKRRLLEILDTLGEEIQHGTPVVGLEPSCTAVFRDELTNMLPHDERATRMRDTTFTLAEFLEQHRDRFHFDAVEKTVLLHGHCHQKSIIGLTADQRLLGRLAGRIDTPEEGCCGMAGAFGFEEKHFDISRAIGERGLLPAVRAAPPDTIIVADGFSCREQVSQLGGKRAIHVAEFLRDSLPKGRSGEDD